MVEELDEVLARYNTRRNVERRLHREEKMLLVSEMRGRDTNRCMILSCKHFNTDSLG
jgi:hypothetical protein